MKRLRWRNGLHQERVLPLLVLWQERWWVPMHAWYLEVQSVPAWWSLFLLKSKRKGHAEQDWIDFIGLVNIRRSKWRIGENWLQTQKRSPIQPWHLRPWQSTQMECFPTPYPFSSSAIYSINHSPLCPAFQISQLLLLFSISHHFSCSNSQPAYWPLSFPFQFSSHPNNCSLSKSLVLRNHRRFPLLQNKRYSTSDPHAFAILPFAQIMLLKIICQTLHRCHLFIIKLSQTPKVSISLCTTPTYPTRQLALTSIFFVFIYLWLLLDFQLLQLRDTAICYCRG